jgi:DNA-binding transcriptional LysR family regulator
LLSKTCPPRDR